MGPPLAALNALAEEHKYRPIQGSILTIGRQVICLGPENYKQFFDGHGIELPPGHKLTLDKRTTFAHAHRESGEFISDSCFFSAFGDCQVTAQAVADRMSGRIGQGVFVRQYEKEGLRPMDMRYGNDEIFSYVRRPDAAALLEGPFLDDVISAEAGRQESE